MDFFEDLSRKISDTAETIGKKTEEAVERQKLRSQMHASEKSLEKAYADLGKQVYKKYEEGETVAEEYWPVCEDIQEKVTVLKQLRQQYAQVNGESECTYCHASIPDDAVFCSKCGSRVEE